MRPIAPYQHDDAVALLRLQLPEFEDLYADLVELYDEDLNASIVFMELADFVADLVIGHDREAVLERSLDVVEQVAAGSGDAAQLVADSFLAELSTLSTERVRPLLGPASARLLEARAGEEAGEALGDEPGQAADDAADEAADEAAVRP